MSLMNIRLIKLFYLLIFSVFTNCAYEETTSVYVITDDIDNFWEAYDKIRMTNDSVLQRQYLKELFLDKGTEGLKGMMEVKQCTSEDYITAINKYPKFWNSVRSNTNRAKQFGEELKVGVNKLKKIYPDLKPVKIYFTISPLKSNGTTLNNKVLIGSELAMTDKNTVSAELLGRLGKNRRKFFDTNPIQDLLLLNIHEYVHTQQEEASDNLLHYVIREGVAEFISVKALGLPSAIPAINYGKNNKRVREKFEEELFANNIYDWLWSDTKNEFGVRDLGYYIGYAICEKYYDQVQNKNEAIKKLMTLNYNEVKTIENFVDNTNYFSDTLKNLQEKFERKRPTIIEIKPFKNMEQEVDYELDRITLRFSESMNPEYRNFNFGPLGKKAAIQIKSIQGFSEDRKLLTFEIESLLPNKRYQLVIGEGFKSLNNIPLKSFLIDFKTKN